MNSALINFNGDFTIHTDKISATDVNYDQLREFEASVSYAGQSQQTQAWHQINLGLFTILNAILQEQIWKKCVGGCRKQGLRERGLLMSVSRRVHRGILLCYAWKRKSYCTDFPKLLPSTCVLMYNSLVT